MASGLINQRIPVNTKMVDIMETGMCQVITFVKSSQTKPISSANAAISPREPPMVPMKSCIWLGICSASCDMEVPLLKPSFTIARGVAPVTASMYDIRDSTGNGQLVI